ncbi:MAG: PAS domain-containing protein, partial [Gammaproteobacteria bacterium]|nr:PAS domain-containing protein [Gammaproteobacteria bacterium]
DGSLRWVHSRGYSVHDESGQPYRVAEIVQDITEFKQTQQTLQEREAMLADAAKLSTLGYATWSEEQHCYLSVSEEIARIYGYSAEEYMRRFNTHDKSLEKIHPEDRAQFEVAYFNQTKTDDVRHYEFRAIRKDKQVRHIKEWARPVKDSAGKPLHTLVTAQDVTDFKRVEAELNQHRAQLENLVEERTAELRRSTEDLESFSYSVSHDLRQPLRAINGFSQALLEDYYESLDDVGRDYLNRVCRASRKMGDLIDSFLSLSRLSRQEMKLEPVWLDELVAEATQELSSINAGRDVDMVIQEGLEAEGDRTLLKVALMNLMSNAWKFTRDQDPARIEFGATGEPGSRTYFLRDNGIGFDMIYADKLFGAFQRLHKVEEFEGLGIGLATVRRIIERHDGHIWAESKPGEGATFYFTLGTRASAA